MKGVFMGQYGFLFSILIGAIAGFIASKIMGRDAEMGSLANIVVGVIGGFIGNKLLGNAMPGFFMQIVSATLGAVILLFVYGLIMGKKK